MTTVIDSKLQKSLAITLKKILDELPYAHDGTIAVNAHFTSSLDEAIKLYTRSRQEALEFLYRNKDMAKARPVELEADFEEVAASCGYFSFSLQDFANETREYLNILDELKLELEEQPDGRTWRWLKVWRRAPEQAKKNSDPGNAYSDGLCHKRSQLTPLRARQPHRPERKYRNPWKYSYHNRDRGCICSSDQGHFPDGHAQISALACPQYLPT